jgi:TonB-linked SusC/RagA family outer membrane protein
MQTRFRFRVLSAFGALVTALLLVVPSLGAQQGGTVTGRVIQTSTGQPVAAVQVFISALDLGGLTQQNGRYLLQNVPAGTHTLSVSRIGYRTVEAQITIGAGQTVEQNFSVAEEALQLDAIIVTGTVGGTTRRSIGNSVTVLDAAAITAQVPITSMQQMLSARTPGLNFTRSDGTLGAGSAINIRGFSSILIGNQPLIYVDGIRVDNSFGLGPDNGFAGFRDAGGSGGSALDDINPADIESIEIIKGPAAATLYGTEASAGVIQIITKKGVVGAPEFTFTARVGENFMIRPASKLGQQFGCRAGRNAWGTPSGTNRRAEDCHEDELIQFNIYDYHAGLITDRNPEVIADNPLGPRDLLTNGLSQAYNLSVNGGTETVRYFMAADWSDATGVVDYNQQSRINLRTNVDVIFSDDISVSFRAAYQEGETTYAQQHPYQGGIWTELIFAQSQHLINHPLNDSTSTGGLAGNGLCPAETNPASPNFGVQLQCNPAHAPTSSVRGDADGFYERDPSHYEGVISLRDYSRFTTSITAQHTVGDWFNQRFIVGVDNSWTENTLLIPRSIGNPRFPFTYTSDGRIVLSQPFSTNFSLDYSASGIYEPNSTLQFVTSAGVQYNRRNSSNFRTQGDVLPSPLFTNLQNATDFDDPTHRVIEDKSLGFFIQEQIGFNGRIFITAAVRADDHSAFGDDFERKYYPKLSGTWTVSEESFWNFDGINSLRVRTAWGQAGRQPNAFARTPQYEVATGPGGSAAIRLNEPGNTEVGPETSQEWEGGLDIAFLDDRIFGEFTYFKQWIRDVIVDADLAPSEGFTGDVQSNLGSLENWGWEASLDFVILDSDAFGLNLRISGDHTANRITFLDPSADTDVNFKEGYFFPNVVFDMTDSAHWDNPNPDSVYVSTNSSWCDFGDPLSPEGLEAGGPSVPCTVSGVERQEIMVAAAFPSYTWSIAPTLRFLSNQLEVFALAEGSYGRWLADIDVDQRGTSGGCSRCNGRQAALFTDGNWFGSRQARDERYTGRYSADFWKLREVGARYQIPQNVVASLGIDRASISMSATNVWTIWRRQWRDRGNVRIPAVESVANFSAEPNFTLQQLPGIAQYNIALRVSF